MIGQTISHYKITEKLGEGGMGIVYKAEDLKLGRTVALKFLKNEALDDEESKKRFFREARAAAAMEHPNVCAVHDIDEQDGQTFLAMSFVEGESIREKAARRPLPLEEALDYAIQTGEGLQAAHAKGIVHRDIKSANLMVTPQGQVKIMDFGLAQLGDQSRLTKTATFLGTPAYMSPEQAERKPTDTRTDIWSLGVALYEMISGRLPFEGETEHGVLYGIVNSQPEPLTAQRVDVPVELDRIVNKAMAKNPAERYQHADEMLVDLRAVRNSLQSVAGAQVTGKVVSGRRLSPVSGIALLAVALGAFLMGWLFDPGPEAPSPPTAVTATPLTAYPGSEIFPSFSPDGGRIVFGWKGENQDNWDIYVRLIGEDTLQQLTNHPAIDSGPAWSPDGRRIAFIRHEGYTSKVMLIPSIGGPEEVVVEGPAILDNPELWEGNFNHQPRFVAWHPGGEHLVISRKEQPGSASRLYLVTLETGDVQRLTTGGTAIDGDWDPAVSADARLLAFRRQFSVFSSALYLVELTPSLGAAGQPRNLTGELFAFSPAWMPDSKEIVFAGGSAERPRLWQVSVAGGEPRRIVQPSEGAFPALSPTGERAAFALVSRDFDIWQAQLPHGRGAKPLVPSTYFDNCPMYSPDGNKIAFSSSRSGYREIWVCDSDGSNAVQLTDLESVNSSQPYWSPDGTQIVFQSWADNEQSIFAVRASGGKPERLTDQRTRDGAPSWSRDGEWIYFNSDRSGEVKIWKIPARGGEAVQVTTERGFSARESLNGQTLYVGDQLSLWSIPVQGGVRTHLRDGEQEMNFTVTRDGIYSLRIRPHLRISFFDFRSKMEEQLFELPGPASVGVSVAPDGQTILFTQGAPAESDIMLVDEFR